MNKHKANGPYEKYFKRIIDIVASGLFMLIFLWLYAVIALVIRIKLGSPVIFNQPRPGKNGNIFNLYKFRSMSNETDLDGNLLPDTQRLNRFGKFLRSTSLDELPEMYNIFNGDMSIVGPRPLLVKYLDYYNDFEMRRHEVRPGLTGLSQVHGRNEISWKNKFITDVQYVDNVTFANDIKIIILTVKKIFIREGIEFKNQETIMEYFKNRK